MSENRAYRLRKGIVALLIGLYILSRIFHFPIPILSTLSFFHFFLLIGLIYFISGKFIRHSHHTDQDIQPHYQHEATRYEVPHYDDAYKEPDLTVRNHVEHITFQYYSHIEKYVQEIRQAIVENELFDLDKMKHSNYFYTMLKKNTNIEAMWTMDQHFNIVAAIPYEVYDAVITDELKQAIEQKQIYVTPIDLVFETPQLLQVIAIPVTNEANNVIAHIGIQTKCV